MTRIVNPSSSWLTRYAWDQSDSPRKLTMTALPACDTTYMLWPSGKAIMPHPQGKAQTTRTLRSRSWEKYSKKSSRGFSFACHKVRNEPARLECRGNLLNYKHGQSVSQLNWSIRFPPQSINLFPNPMGQALSESNRSICV